MNDMKQFTALLVAACVGMLSAEATLIRPVSVTSTIVGDAGSHVDYLIGDNGGFGEAGLQRPVGNAVTLNTGASLADAQATFAALSGAAHAESWTANVTAGNPVFVFDLGADTSIGTVVLWQYGNNGGPGSDNSGNMTKNFSLIFHTESDGSGIDFGSESIDFTDTMALITGETTADNIAQTFQFPSVTARYVGLRIDDNYGPDTANVADGGRFGLGEVRFATESLVPEPMSIGLLALGGLLLLVRRR